MKHITYLEDIMLMLARVFRFMYQHIIAALMVIGLSYIANYFISWYVIEWLMPTWATQNFAYGLGIFWAICYVYSCAVFVHIRRIMRELGADRVFGLN